MKCDVRPILLDCSRRRISHENQIGKAACGTEGQREFGDAGRERTDASVAIRPLEAQQRYVLRDFHRSTFLN